ncbi:hypothetical protein DPEC_G00291330 [Dallia pectoralis]|uniref:Uncharacterized protein n=1 Tax=Dallia pectoralis TaxID=75939 RepID=A0ACC2FHM2_DALPE|nr:hypothetical protein DPEC_G00291330 [Dallia pectoralis]
MVYIVWYGETWLCEQILDGRNGMGKREKQIVRNQTRTRGSDKYHSTTSGRTEELPFRIGTADISPQCYCDSYSSWALQTA